MSREDRLHMMRQKSIRQLPLLDDGGKLIGVETFDELIAALKRERDELALKIHLGTAEARDDLERLNEKLDELRTQAAPLSEIAGDTAKGVGAAMELAAEEIKKGFDRLRGLLK